MAEQLGLFDESVSVPVADSSTIGDPISDQDAFGCCSKYYDCSKAFRCLIPERDYSIHCTYRKNLEAGRVFYSKKAITFDHNIYTSILHKVDALSKRSRNALYDLLILFCEYKRGTPSIIVRKDQTSGLSSIGLFQFSPLGSKFTRSCAYRSYLLPELKPAPIFVQAQSVRAAERQIILNSLEKAKLDGNSTEISYLESKLNAKPSEKSAEFAYSWLDHDGAALRDQLAAPYRLAVLPPELAIYAEELWRDRVFSSDAYDKRVYPQSPLAQDGLLSAYDYEEEELRRVKLSHGYSQEEREKRLNAIQQARNARSNKEQAEKPQKSSPLRNRHYNPNADNPFFSKVCSITGTLERMERSRAFAELCKCGAVVSNNATKKDVDILILGRQEWSEQHDGIASQKIQNAVGLQESGHNVEMMSEDQFYSALDTLMPLD